jgi:hypothetical protein
MNKRKQDWTRYANVGPGGMHCPCCAPPPGEGKRKVLRAAKRRMRRDVNAEIQEEVDEITPNN